MGDVEKQGGDTEVVWSRAHCVLPATLNSPSAEKEPHLTRQVRSGKAHDSHQVLGPAPLTPSQCQCPRKGSLIPLGPRQLAGSRADKRVGLRNIIHYSNIVPPSLFHHVANYPICASALGLPATLRISPAGQPGSVETEPQPWGRQNWVPSQLHLLLASCPWACLPTSEPW